MSARTSGNGRPTELSEAEYLEREANQAKAAIDKTMEELKQSLSTAADLRLWAEHHPWLVVGVAAAAGFTAGSAIASIGSAPAAPPPQPASQPRKGSAMWSSLMSPLFELAKIAIQSSVAATAAGVAASNETESPPAEAQPVVEPTGESVPF